MNNLVIAENGKAMTNSLLVAQGFEKQHKDVLESIRNLTAENSAVLQMFVESTYINEQGKEQPLFIMTRDGFSLLVMSFTGKRAMQFKIDFINAFNQMEEQLKTAQPKQLTPTEMLLQSVQLLVDQERKVATLTQRVDEIEARTTTRQDWFAVAGYASLRRIHVNRETASVLGRRASGLCRARGLTPGKIFDPRYGEVCTYPQFILEEVFTQPINKIS